MTYNILVSDFHRLYIIQSYKTLTTFPVLYITPLWLIYNCWFVPLNSLHLFCHFLPVLTTSSFSVLFVWFFIFHIWYLSFSVWFILLSKTPSTRSTLVVTNSKISFFSWLSNVPQWVGMYTYTGPHIFLSHSSISGHLGYFHILCIVNKAAMSTGALPFQISFFVFFGWTARKGTTGSYGSSYF